MDIKKSDALEFLSAISVHIKETSDFSRLSDEDLSFIKTTIKVSKKEVLLSKGGNEVDFTNTTDDALKMMTTINDKIMNKTGQNSRLTEVWNFIKELIHARENPDRLLSKISKFSSPRDQLKF